MKGDTAIQLNELPMDTWARVVEVIVPTDSVDRELVLRLVELGFVPDERVRVVASGPPRAASPWPCAWAVPPSRCAGTKHPSSWSIPAVGMEVSTVRPPERIALLGNPNCGKTALFNLLTGSRQKVANYAGVTVERKEGTLHTSAGRKRDRAGPARRIQPQRALQRRGHDARRGHRATAAKHFRTCSCA